MSDFINQIFAMVFGWFADKQIPWGLKVWAIFCLVALADTVFNLGLFPYAGREGG